MSMRQALLVALTLGLAASPAMAETRSSHTKHPRLTLVAVESEPTDGRTAPTDAEIDVLAQAVEADPKSRQARFDLVRALMRAGKLQDALAEARAWREKDAYNLVVVRLLGDIYSELGDTKNALRAYSAVVELLPKDYKAQRALASVLKQQGNLEAAYERLATAARERPEDMRIAFELADVAHRLGKFDEARERFEAISRSDDTNMAVRYPAMQRLAQIYATMRREAVTQGKSQEAGELDARIKALDIKGGAENDIKIYLTWDTDRSDVDLWVTNPAGEKISYQHKNGRFGDALYDDVTTGYGPESFTAPQAKPGAYLVQVNYYSAGQSSFPEARGEVIVVLGEGTEHEERHVLPYRLFHAGQTVTVARIEAR